MNQNAALLAEAERATYHQGNFYDHENHIMTTHSQSK